MSGYRDSIDNSAKDYFRHAEYKSADRAFSSDYGKLENYQDGYRQGFETGYDTGYQKLGFDATIPADLTFRGPLQKQPAEATVKIPKETGSAAADNIATVPVNDVTDQDLPAANVPTNAILTDPDDTPLTQQVSDSVDPAPKIKTPRPSQQSALSGDEIIIIPAETELIIELLDELDTKTLREGDQFTARVVTPAEISGAIIEGRVAKNRKPGRLKRRAELILSFDRIVLSNSRWSNFNAIITEVLPIKGDNVKRVDNEGTVEGQRPYKSDATKVGAATGTGVVIGAIVGGPVGAAVGAGVGAAFGVGAVVVERGKYIMLLEQQQLRIKTAYETQIR